MARVNLPGRCLWIFTSARDLPPAINYTLHFAIAFVIKFMILSDILYIFPHFPFVVPYLRLSFRFSMLQWHFTALSWRLWGCIILSIVGHLFLLFSCDILFVLLEIVCYIQADNRFPFLCEQLEFSTSLVNTLSVCSCWRLSFFWFFWIWVVFFFVIRVCLLFISIYSVAQPVYHGWTWID